MYIETYCIAAEIFTLKLLAKEVTCYCHANRFEDVLRLLYPDPVDYASGIALVEMLWSRYPIAWGNITYVHMPGLLDVNTKYAVCLKLCYYSTTQPLHVVCHVVNYVGITTFTIMIDYYY